MTATTDQVSVLFNEPKLLKYDAQTAEEKRDAEVSVLFNEPKLLKSKKGKLQPY